MDFYNSVEFVRETRFHWAKALRANEKYFERMENVEHSFGKRQCQRQFIWYIPYTHSCYAYRWELKQRLHIDSISRTSRVVLILQQLDIISNGMWTLMSRGISKVHLEMSSNYTNNNKINFYRLRNWLIRKWFTCSV